VLAAVMNMAEALLTKSLIQEKSLTKPVAVNKNYKKNR